MAIASDSQKLSPRVLGILAVLVSLGVHLGLLRVNPLIQFGGGRGFSSPERVAVIPRLTLDSLRETSLRELPLDSGDLFPVDSPIEDVAGLDPARVEEDFTASDVDEVLEVLELDVPIEALAPGRLPAELSFFESAWDARAEVLAIREPRVEERIEALPRRIESRPEPRDVVSDLLPSVQDLARDDMSGLVGIRGALRLFPEMRAVTRVKSSVGGGALGEGVIDVPAAEEMERRPGLRPGLRPEALQGHREQNGHFQPSAQSADHLLTVTALAYVDPNRPRYRYFKVQLSPSGLEELPEMSREILILLDATSRVTPDVFRQVSQAVGGALGELGGDDRFNVLILQQESHWLFEEGLAATPLNVARARGRLAQIRPQGSGNLFTGLERLLGAEGEPNRPRIGIVLTDGVASMGVGETTAYLEQFSRANQGEVSIFTIGVGRQVNRYLLDFLSFRNRGDSLVTEQNMQVGEALMRTIREIRRPVLRHLSYRFAGGERLSVYPQSLTHLYLDRPLILVGRVPVEQETLTFQIVGNSGQGAHDMIYTLDVSRIPPGSWVLRQDWAWQALLDEVGGYLQSRNPEALERIRGLSRAYGLAIPYGLN